MLYLQMASHMEMYLDRPRRGDNRMSPKGMYHLAMWFFYSPVVGNVRQDTFWIERKSESLTDPRLPRKQGFNDSLLTEWAGTPF